MRAIRDVLIEDCTATGYVMGDDPGPPPAVSSTDNPPAWHPGLFAGNSGITNVVIRNCTMNGPTGARGFPWAIFFDGGRGVVVHNVTLTGKWHSGGILFLTNDDYLLDIDADGHYSRDQDFRNAHDNVVSQVTVSQGLYTFVGITGYRCLVTGCSVEGGCTEFAALSPRCTKYWQNGLIYEHWGNVIDANIVPNGNVTRFVTHYPDSGDCPGDDAEDSHRGRIGITELTNNSVPNGVVGDWILDYPGSTLVSDGPNIESNNTDDSVIPPFSLIIAPRLRRATLVRM
jgi:hypothetical protein